MTLPPLKFDIYLFWGPPHPSRDDIISKRSCIESEGSDPLGKNQVHSRVSILLGHNTYAPGRGVGGWLRMGRVRLVVTFSGIASVFK